MVPARAMISSAAMEPAFMGSESNVSSGMASEDVGDAEDEVRVQSVLEQEARERLLEAVIEPETEFDALEIELLIGGAVVGLEALAGALVCGADTGGVALPAGGGIAADVAGGAGACEDGAGGATLVLGGSAGLSVFGGSAGLSVLGGSAGFSVLGGSAGFFVGIFGFFAATSTSEPSSPPSDDGPDGSPPAPPALAHSPSPTARAALAGGVVKVLGS